MNPVIVRDPLWKNIRLDALARQLVDTPEFQRLRYVRQLGLAYFVYPGASHSRFEHALGTYHLACRALVHLRDAGELDAREAELVRAAALLHDLGHYPFSHALEEIGAPHHEEIGGRLIGGGRIGEILVRMLGDDAPARVGALIRGESESPLQRLISGSLDLDKIEYLKRDAFMCGVPYGEVDVERLLHSLVLVADPVSSRPTVGVREKGLSALESLLFAKYQMYRNVYWHHAVRSATSMYKRLVHDAVRVGALDLGTLPRLTDEGLLHQLQSQGTNPLLAALRERRLYKRVLECPAVELQGAAEWISEDHERVVASENALAREVGVDPGAILLDYPAKTQMLGLDIPVLRRSGDVRRLTHGGWEGTINLPRLSDELYKSARWLRVFAPAGVKPDRERLWSAIRSR